MFRQLITIRNLTLATILVLGLVSVISIFVARDTMIDAVNTSVRNGTQQMIETALRANAAEMRKQLVEMLNRVQGRQDFRLAFNQFAAQPEALQAQLDDPLINGYTNAYQLDLLLLRSYDTKFNLLGSSSVGASLAQLPQQLIAQLQQRQGQATLQAQGGYWEIAGQPLYSMFVAIGGIQAQGYLEAVINPIHSIRQLDDKLPFPLEIESVTAAARYSYRSEALQGDDQYHFASRQPVVVTIGEPQQPAVLQMKGYEDFDLLTRSIHRSDLIIALLLLITNIVSVLLAIWLLNRLIFRPLREIVSLLIKVKEGDYSVHFAPRGVCEFEQLTDTLNQMLAQIHQRNQQLESLSVTDALTGIANRRCFDQTLEQEWLRARREQYPLSVALLDIDFFKLYNDHYGHQQGDSCLIKVATLIAAQARRPNDMVARYGGEEFVMVFSGTDSQQAAEIALRVVSEVNRANFPHEKSSIGKRVTVSIGVATVIPGQHPSSQSSDLVESADRALYHAKHEGRNRVALLHPDGSIVTELPTLTADISSG
ncbi:MAG: diguanylate cyclase [Gammaproteobacteria bacterium]|nr:diguanylate cyclase [Gammaproteobacteria bacterium]